MTDIPWWIVAIERFFVGFTAALVAFGILTVEIEVLHWLWTKIKRERTGERKASLGDNPGTGHGNPVVLAQTVALEPSVSLKNGAVVRFSIHQRVQHFLFFTSFLTLAVTGLAEKFYTFGPAWSLIQALGGWDGIRIIHRSAAGVMGFTAVYHIVYVSRNILTLKDGGILAIIPSLKDFQDFKQTMGLYLGIYKDPPRFGKYTYMQKFDYWAVFWGIAVMGISGIIMLSSAFFGRWIGTPAVAASLAAHSEEAILAVAWIFLVHLFHAHLSPRIFPFNATIFTGKMPLHRLREEHPLEYERLVAAGAISSKEKPLS